MSEEKKSNPFLQKTRGSFHSFRNVQELKESEPRNLFQIVSSPQWKEGRQSFSLGFSVSLAFERFPVFSRETNPLFPSSTPFFFPQSPCISPQRTFEKSINKAFFKVPFFLVAQNKTESGFFSSLSVKNKAEKILDSQQFFVLFVFFAVEKNESKQKEKEKKCGQKGIMAARPWSVAEKPVCQPSKVEDWSGSGPLTQQKPSPIRSGCTLFLFFAGSH